MYGLGLDEENPRILQTFRPPALAGFRRRSGVARSRHRADGGSLFLAFPFNVALGSGYRHNKHGPGSDRVFSRVFTNRQKKPRPDRRQTRNGLSFRVSGVEELFFNFDHDAHGLHNPASSHSHGHRRDDLFYNGIGHDLRQLAIFQGIFR